MAGPAKIIQDKRERLGIKEEDISRAIGVPLDTYWDIEHHDDEILEHVPLWAIKKLVNALNLDLLELLGIPNEFSPGLETDRGLLIERRRLQMGISIPDLSQASNIEAGFFEGVAANAGLLDSLHLPEILGLAKSLEIPPGLLLKAETQE